MHAERTERERERERGGEKGRKKERAHIYAARVHSRCGSCVPRQGGVGGGWEEGRSRRDGGRGSSAPIIGVVNEF